MKSSPKTVLRENLTYKHKVGLLLVSLSTLMLEFNLIRVLSVSLWYHFAFMVISIALLGFGVSGVTLVLSDRLKRISISTFTTVVSLLFSISIVLSFYIINLIPFDPFSLFVDAKQFIYLPIYYLTVTLPFFLAGLVVGSIFTRFKNEIGKLYFFDLFGAGISCFIFIIIMPLAGGSGSIVVVSIIAALSAIIFSFEKSKVSGLGLIGGTIIIIINILFLTSPDDYLPIKVTVNKFYGNYISEHPELRILTEWNTFSRVDVLKDEDPPVDSYPVYLAVIDAGNSTTNIPHVPVVSDTLSPPFDASNLAMVLKPDSSSVFIIGSGGGGEILTALSHKAGSVTAVEINGLLNNLVKVKFASYWTTGLAKNKKVNIITDDARGYLRGSKSKYDVIISAHTISASATASGAMSLVENYILTEEAIKDYLKHMKNDGILYISRPEPQIPRLVATIKSANSELKGGASKNNFFIFRRPPSEFEKDISFLCGVIFKKDGFNENDIAILKTNANLLSTELMYDPVSNQEGIYNDIVQSDNLKETLNKYPQILTPATDDNPYFEHQTRFIDLNPAKIKETFSQTDRAVLSLTEKPAAESTLIVLLIQVAILSFLLIVIPIFLKFRKAPVLVNIPKGKYILYFSLLGLGYIMIEICLIQKFTLFLGQPVYTMLTVISTMLIFSGFGSLYSEKIIKKLKNKVHYLFIGIAFLILLIGFLNPIIFTLFESLDIILKVIISVILLAPLSFMMGIPFPYGIQKIPTHFGHQNPNLSYEPDINRYLVAYCWGVNGFFSVIGSIMVVILSMSYGFKAVFATTGIIYLLAMLSSKLKS